MTLKVLFRFILFKDNLLKLFDYVSVNELKIAYKMNSHLRFKNSVSTRPDGVANRLSQMRTLRNILVNQIE